MTQPIPSVFAPEQSLSRQMTLLFAGRMIAFLVVFAVPLVLVRIFSPAEFGLYKQLFLISTTLTSLLSLGLPASLFYFVLHHPSERHAYIFQTLVALGCLGILGGGVLVALKSQIAAAFNNPDLVDLIPYVAAFSAIYLVSIVLETLMIVLKQTKLSALSVITSEILRAGLLIVLAVWTRSMAVILLGAILWSACRLLALVGYLKRLGMPMKLVLDRDHLARQFRYAAPFGLAVIVGTFAESLHQFAVSYLYSPSVFAIYSVAYLQIPLVGIAFESISDVTLVRVTELRKEGLLQAAVGVLGESVTKLWIVLLPLSVLLLVSARDLIHLLFTDRFDASVDIFRIFLVTIPLTALGLDYVPRAFADTGFVFRIKVLSLVLSAGLLMALVGPMGLAGAAVATVLVTLIIKFVILLKASNLFNVPISRILPWKRLAYIGAASAASGACAWAVQSVVSGSGGLRLLLCSLAFITSYALLVWYGDMLDPGVRRRISEMAGLTTKYILSGLALKAKRIG